MIKHAVRSISAFALALILATSASLTPAHAEKSFKIAVAASGFEAGIQAESFHPDCIVVDFSIGKIEALQICQNLRRNPEYGETILIALLPDDGSSISFDRSTINETFKKPFDAQLLAERLKTLIGARKELV